MRRKITGMICILSSIAILVVTALQYIPKFMEYKKARDYYDDISDRYTSDPEEESESVLEDIEKETSENPYLSYLRDEEKTELEMLRDVFEEEGIRANPRDFLSIDVDSEGLLKENEDYVGWLYVPNTSISYPVVQGKDNNEYLHANFKKEYSYPGTIFMDALCKNGIFSHHCILYGHNMRDGSMFAETKQFTDQKFFEDHPVFWFITPKYKLLYRVFSCFVVDPKDPVAFSYDGVDFKSNEEWDETVNELKKKSVVKCKHEVSGKDFVLSLSTCTNERTTRVFTSGVLLGNVETNNK